MSRPRGYFTWNPKPQSLALIANVKQVLDENRAYLPLTARQIFYMLVGQFDYEKTEQAYARLCEALVKARRSQMIGFNMIRDDGTTVLGFGGNGYASPKAFWETIRDSADSYFVKRHEGQPCRIEVWCEAAGMAPMLEGFASDYDVKVYSTGGFSSVTVTYEIAQRVLGREVPTVFLHVGDYDPSGESIFESMTEDVSAFVYGHGGTDEHFVARRIALTAEQVEEYALETAPPKRSDSRSANWFGETAQLEAMPPATLEELIREAIVDELDMDLRQRVLDREAKETEQIREQLEAIMVDFDEDAE